MVQILKFKVMIYRSNNFRLIFAFSQASAGSIGGGQGPHGVSGSQSIASSQSQSATFGFGPFTASFSQSQANAGAGAGAGGRADYGPGDYF